MRAANPRGAIADFRTVYEQAGSNRWKFALVSAVATISIFSVMIREEGRGLPKPPQITYITTLPPGRSDAEIMKENRENQVRKERLAAEQAKRDEEVKAIYRTIGRASGMDVDAIEKKAKADQLAQDRAKAAALAAQTRPAPQGTPAP